MALMLRAGRASDAGDVGILHLMSWRDAFQDVLDPDFLDGPAEDLIAEHWQTAMRGRRRTGQVLVAVSGKQLNGFVATTQDKLLGHVDSLHVRPGMRGAGIGTSLLGLAAQRLRQQGAVSVDLHVFADNAGAIRLYRRLGGEVASPMPRPVFGQEVQQRRVAWPRIEKLIQACGG